MPIRSLLLILLVLFSIPIYANSKTDSCIRYKCDTTLQISCHCIKPKHIPPTKNTPVKHVDTSIVIHQCCTDTVVYIDIPGKKSKTTPEPFDWCGLLSCIADLAFKLWKMLAAIILFIAGQKAAQLKKQQDSNTYNIILSLSVYVFIGGGMVLLFISIIPIEFSLSLFLNSIIAPVKALSFPLFAFVLLAAAIYTWRLGYRSYINTGDSARRGGSIMPYVLLLIAVAFALLFMSSEIAGIYSRLCLLSDHFPTKFLMPVFAALFAAIASVIKVSELFLRNQKTEDNGNRSTVVVPLLFAFSFLLLFIYFAPLIYNLKSICPIRGIAWFEEIAAGITGVVVTYILILYINSSNKFHKILVFNTKLLLAIILTAIVCAALLYGSFHAMSNPYPALYYTFGLLAFCGLGILITWLTNYRFNNWGGAGKIEKRVASDLYTFYKLANISLRPQSALEEEIQKSLRFTEHINRVMMHQGKKLLYMQHGHYLFDRTIIFLTNIDKLRTEYYALEDTDKTEEGINKRYEQVLRIAKELEMYNVEYIKVLEIIVGKND